MDDQGRTSGWARSSKGGLKRGEREQEGSIYHKCRKKCQSKADGQAGASEAIARMSKDDSVSNRARWTSKVDDQGELDCAMNDMKIYMKYLWC